MTRSGTTWTLVLALAWVAVAQGQSTPASAPESRVGKVITVSEANRAPEKCKVLQVWRLSDGSPAMQAQAIDSGEMLSIVETPKAANPAERFRVFRWGMNGMPPVGCPVPPGAKVPVVAEAPNKTVIAGSVKQVAGKVAASTKGETVVQAPYLPPASASETVVQARTSAKAMPNVMELGTKQTSVKTGPVIVGQPDVPVVLADGSASAEKTVIATGSPVVQAQATAPMPKVDAPAAPAPALKAAAPAAPVAGGAVACEGNTIIVTEPNCAPAQCQVLSVSCDRLGHKTMQVKNLCTGECFTLVEGGHYQLGSLLSRFCILRGKQSCPCACESCAAGGAPVVGPKSMPVEKAPMPAPKASAMSDGPSKFGSLLPPGEAPVLNDKAVVATSQPEMVPVPSKPVPSLAQTTVMTPAKSSGERSLKKLFSRSEEKPAASKPETLPKSEPVKDSVAKSEMPAKPKETARPEEKKADTKPVEKVKKTELAAVEMPAKPSVPVEPAMAKPNDLPVPVPLIPLATTEPRPTAPPPQPPINPYSTMGSTSMVKYGPQDTLPPMCPTCHRALPNSGSGVETSGLQQASMCPNCQPAMPMSGMGGLVSQSGWTRGPVRPVSQSPVMVPARRLMTETEAQAMQNTVHLMTVLQSSGVPAQREWAASRLRVCDPQMHPYVVEALVTAAKTDGAAMVRASAIQSLAQMKATDPSVIVMMENARQDRDPRVRDEAIIAVQLLTGEDTTSVQPAMHTIEKQ